MNGAVDLGDPASGLAPGLLEALELVEVALALASWLRRCTFSPSTESHGLSGTGTGPARGTSGSDERGASGSGRKSCQSGRERVDEAPGGRRVVGRAAAGGYAAHDARDEGEHLEGETHDRGLARRYALPGWAASRSVTRQVQAVPATHAPLAPVRIATTTMAAPKPRASAATPARIAPTTKPASRQKR